MRRPLVLLTAGLVLAGPFALGYELAPQDRGTTPVSTPTVVDRVRHALAARYYRTVPGRVLRLGSVGAMISALGDPYTSYLAPPDYRLVRQETAARYSGIGVSVLPSRAGLVVAALRPGPALTAGVRVGDTIVGIGDAPAGRLGATQALARILGPRGTQVRLQLLRDGRLLHLSVRRDVVRMPVVHAKLLSYAGRRWGEVRVSSFRAGTAGLLRHELGRLRRQGALGFVLDLRENPGGLLDEAVAVSSLFLDHGVIVSLSGAHTPLHTYRAYARAATRMPLVVLVDRYSASSAEVVAAALRDNRRAAVVGQRTFGKALVQSLDPLGNGAALELTVAHYYTPSGQDISGTGVVPQVSAADDPRTPSDEALGAALRVLARPAS